MRMLSKILIRLDDNSYLSRKIANMLRDFHEQRVLWINRTYSLSAILIRLDYNSYLSRKIANMLRDFHEQRVLWVNRTYSEYFVFDHKAIWSSPRSGNHWVRFIAEYLTGCPTSGCITNHTDIPIYTNTFPSEENPLAHVNPENPFILYKSHCAYSMTSGSAILLLIRDYHEYIARLGIDKTTEDGRLQHQAFYYLELIATYDRFCGTKILIYYEDLLKYPEKEIYRIKDFLGASDERYKAFMARYDYYEQLSKQAGGRVWNDDNSKGDLKFYWKKLGKQEMLIRKNLFYAISGVKRYQCVKPYLARYE